MQTIRTTLPRLRHEKTEVERLNVFNGLTQELLNFVSGYRAAVDGVRGNKDLSSTGQDKQVAKINESFTQTFNNEFPQRLARIKAQFQAEADANYRPKPYQPDPNPVLEYLKGREIRDHLNSLPMGERLKPLLDPSLDSTGAILHHAQVGPVPMSGVTADILSRAHQARAEALNPEGQLAVADQAAILETLTHNIGEVAKVLGIVSTETAEDPADVA